MINLSTTDKNHLKTQVFDTGVVNGLRQAILFMFIPAKLPGCKVFCEHETIQHRGKK